MAYDEFTAELVKDNAALRARVEKLDRLVALAAAYRLAVRRGWSVRKISKALDAALAGREEVGK